jgi:tRNA A37 methylthiotransferase MiaB
MKVYVVASSHCPRRRLDATQLKRYFNLNGCELTASASDADISILVTCAYTQKTEDIAMDMVKRFCRDENKLMVTGCLPAINPERLSSVFEDISISPHSLHEIDQYFPEFKVKFCDIADANEASIAIALPSHNLRSMIGRFIRHPIWVTSMFLRKRRRAHRW